MTAAPAGQTKAAEENAPAPVTEETQHAEVETVQPAPPGPNDPVEDGVVEVSKKAETAKEKEVADPAGNVVVRRKATRTHKKGDVFDDVDLTKLPIAAGVGQVTGEIKEYAGRAVVALSLKGWVGDAPFKILASDLHEIEDLLAELRKQLG